MNARNLFHLPPLPENEELVTKLAQSDCVRIERIISTGQASGWYNQDESEFVALLQGEARLTWEDGATTALGAGDTLIIPPHKRHRVSHTSSNPPCVWLCVFWR